MLEVVNKTPVRDAFHFVPLCDGLHAAGCYTLRFVLSPALPTHAAQSTELTFSVAAGGPAQIVLKASPHWSLCNCIMARGSSLHA